MFPAIARTQATTSLTGVDCDDPAVLRRTGSGPTRLGKVRIAGRMPNLSRQLLNSPRNAPVGQGAKRHHHPFFQCFKACPSGLLLPNFKFVTGATTIESIG